MGLRIFAPAHARHATNDEHLYAGMMPYHPGGLTHGVCGCYGKDMRVIGFETVSGGFSSWSFWNILEELWSI